MGDDVIVDHADQLVGQEGLCFGHFVSGRGLFDQTARNLETARILRIAQQIDDMLASLAAAVFGDDGLDAFDEIATVDHGAGRGNTDHAVHGSRLLDGRHGY